MIKRTCIIAGCVKDQANSRGWCPMHYQRWRKTGDPLSTPTGRIRQDKVEVNACVRMRKEANASKPKHRHQCIGCSTAYETSHRKPSFCSAPCRTKWMDVNNPARCSTSGCDKGVRSLGLCHLHHKQVKRSMGTPGYNDPWNERRKANSQQRRAMKLGTQTEKVKSLTVYERDAWTCGLCSTPVDKNLSHPHPMSASLDHVLPLAKGGTHTYTNVQLAHLTCNISKGARVAA